MKQTESLALDGANWQSKWNNLKRRFPRLSDADLEDGKCETGEMFRDLARKLGLNTDELQIVIMTS